MTCSLAEFVKQFSFILLISLIIFGYLSFDLNVWSSLGVSTSEQIVFVQSIYVLFLLTLPFIIEHERSHHPLIVVGGHQK